MKPKDSLPSPRARAHPTAGIGLFSRRQARDAGFTVKDIELHISADVTDRPAYVLSTIRATVGW